MGDLHELDVCFFVDGPDRRSARLRLQEFLAGHAGLAGDVRWVTPIDMSYIVDEDDGYIDSDDPDATIEG